MARWSKSRSVAFGRHGSNVSQKSLVKHVKRVLSMVLQLVFKHALQPLRD